MKAAAWVMSNPTRWTLALRSGRLGRVLGRKRGVIGEVPLPVASQWTATRDLARPPQQTFRDWWAAEHAEPTPDPGPTAKDEQ